MVVVKLIIRILLLPVRISLTIVQLVVMFITWLSATVFHILSGIICITAILGYGFGQETGTEMIRMLAVGFLLYVLDDNLLYIYDLNINSEEFGKYPANKTQTIQEQKNQGRRPHVSLKTLFVDANNLEPDIIFDIRRCKAYDRLSEYYQRLIGK